MRAEADLSKALGSYLRVGILVFLLVLINRGALAQSAAGPPAQSGVIVLGSQTNPPPDILDGTLSGLGDEEEDDSPKSSWFRFPTFCNPGWTSSRTCCSNNTAS